MYLHTLLVWLLRIHRINANTHQAQRREREVKGEGVEEAFRRLHVWTGF
jgi:hypothetical protein